MLLTRNKSAKKAAPRLALLALGNVFRGIGLPRGFTFSAVPAQGPPGSGPIFSNFFDSRGLFRGHETRVPFSAMKGIFPLHACLLGALTALILERELKAETAHDRPIDVGATLDSIVSRDKIPGMAAVVLRGDQIVAQGVGGVRKKGSSERVTIEDQFVLNSAGKAMTATLAAMIVEEGKLSWNTTLGSVFSDGDLGMRPEWKAVTLAQLLDHRAGMPADFARIWTLLRVHFFSRGSAAEKRHRIVIKTFSRAPEYPPGTRYVYSSLDYFVVCALLEKITGRPCEDLIRERLWQPLNIGSGGFGVPGGSRKIDQPRGHWGMAITGHPVAPGGFWARLSSPLFFGPVAAGHMTIVDWAKFIALHLRGDPANPHQKAALLSADSFAILHQATRGKFYESGWILLTRPWANGHREGDTGRVISSQGDNGFWHCEAWIAPEIDFAVLIMCNQGGAADNKAAAIASRHAIESLVRDFAPKP
jgi:CubicO group peptidase (beta-lactamase class C family)